MKRFCLLLASVTIFYVLFGCFPSNRLMQPNSPTRIQSTNTLQVGITQKKNIGEPMLVVSRLTTYQGYVTLRDFQPPPFYILASTVTYPLIKKGVSWKPIGVIDSGDIALEASAPLYTHMGGRVQMAHRYGLLVNPVTGQPHGEVLYDPSHAHVYPRLWEGFSIGEPVLAPAEVHVEGEGGYKMEFIYNGKSKDSIKIQYREFKNDLARPSFYQDLSYDLSESMIVGFREMKIEVIEATNSHITFKVLSGLAPL